MHSHTVTVLSIVGLKLETFYFLLKESFLHIFNIFLNCHQIYEILSDILQSHCWNSLVDLKFSRTFIFDWFYYKIPKKLTILEIL